MVRALRLTSPAKSRTATATKKAIHPAIKSVTSTGHKTTAIGNVGKAAVAKATKTKRIASARPIHAITSGYAGTSSGLTKNRSKTALNVSAWGSTPNRTLTERTMAVLYPVRERYKGQTFSRGNLDAGVLNAAGAKGVIEFVGGDPASESVQLRFTKAGLNEKFVKTASPD